MKKDLNSLARDLKQNEPNVTCTSATVTSSNKVSESANDKLASAKALEESKELSATAILKTECFRNFGIMEQKDVIEILKNYGSMFSVYSSRIIWLEDSNLNSSEFNRFENLLRKNGVDIHAGFDVIVIETTL